MVVVDSNRGKKRDYLISTDRTGRLNDLISVEINAELPKPVGTWEVRDEHTERLYL